MLDMSAAEAVVDAKDAAEYAGLAYVTDDKPGISRKRSGHGFRYIAANGGRLDEPARKRIKALAIPPAWTEVWICPRANGHIQATGRDAKGRKQYRYHARFREVRESTKYQHMLDFAESLPAIRKKVINHLALSGLPRQKVLATVVNLLEATLIRVGSDEYAKHNQSYGLTTLKNRHVEVDGSALRFNFKGKSGKVWRLNVRDRRVAKVIRACQSCRVRSSFNMSMSPAKPAMSRLLTSMPTCKRSAARTSPPRTFALGTAPCLPPWRSRSSRSSIARPGPKGTFAKRSSA